MNLLCAKFTVCPHDWHRPDFVPRYNKFIYISEGCGRITLNGIPVFPKAGQLFFAPAGVVQSFSAINASPLSMYWCHFTSNLELHPLFRSMGIPNLVPVEEDARLLGCFRQLADNGSNNALTASIKTRSALMEIMAQYIDQAGLEERSDPNEWSVNKLLDTVRYIDANLNKDITIQELSQTVHFHPNYFIRFFKAHFGVSPMKYIYDRRMEQAQELLACTSLTILEVAHLAGFHEASHFSASFKKHTGVSPTEFRQFIGAEQRSSAGGTQGHSER